MPRRDDRATTVRYRVRRMRVDHRFFPVNDTRLHALHFGGKGRPIILLHGVTGHAWMWHDVAGQLTLWGQVLAVELRGHGESQWSANGDYRTDVLVADLAAVIDRFEQPADVVGLSWGGLVALRLAARNPSLVNRLAVLDVPTRFDVGREQVPNRPGSFPDRAAVVAWDRSANPAAADHLIELVADHGVRPGPDGSLVRKHDPLFLRDWPFRSESFDGDWTSIQAPTLLVRAGASSVLPAAAFEAMLAANPAATGVTIEQSGHLLPLDRPIEVADALEAFLREEALAANLIADEREVLEIP